MKTKSDLTKQWRMKWIASVAEGANTMSSRKLSSIKKRGGGLRQVAAAAKSKKVHLLLLEDDKGEKIVAASNKPFKVIA